MDSGYFKWLISLVGGGENYKRLLAFLSQEPFTWDKRIDIDSDRADDGLALREAYILSTGKRIDVSYDECSVLEMLIALVNRADRDIFGDPENPYGPELFWHMLENAGLLIFSDRMFDECAVANVIYNIMLRNYDKHGNGNFFPIESNYENQKQVPIWDQLCRYIIEKYKG